VEKNAPLSEVCTLCHSTCFTYSNPGDNKQSSIRAGAKLSFASFAIGKIEYNTLDKLTQVNDGVLSLRLVKPG